MSILRLFIFLLISISLCAFNGGPVPEKALKKAERKYGGEVVRRYLSYNKMLRESKHLSPRHKLQTVNDFFNAVPFQEDINVWKKDDYWATPLEFLARNKGDSEDYVISKYFALLTMGLNPKTLYFTYVNVEERKAPHMVLSYFEKPSAEPFILDNLTPDILSASDRNDLTPVYNFNPDLTDPSQDAQVQQSTHKKWEKLYKRVQRNKL